MFTNIDEFQKFSKDRVESATKTATQVSKGIQQIFAESADYSKKSLENTSSAVGQLFSAKSIDKAFEIQSDFAKSAYDGFVAQATKMSELYANLAKEAFKTPDFAPVHGQA